VVLLKIDAAGLTVFEFKRYAPRSVDVNRIALWIEALQRMKVEAWDVHFLGSNGHIEAIESRKNALVHFASIFELFPFIHSSERALLLRVRITI
jgi:UDP-N-acetyl-D-mannosaminuronic acid transferase (WecB/TagA/CpsF family)